MLRALDSSALAMPLRSLLLALFLAITAATLPVRAQTPQFDTWFEAENRAAIDKEIARLQAADPDDRIAQLATARLGVELDGARLDAGIAAVERCVARNEADADCHLWLGRAYGRKAIEAGMLAGLRYTGRIRAHFERAADLAPDWIEPRENLVQFFVLAPAIAGGGKGKAREAIAAYAQRRPVEATLLQAQLNMAEERYAEAEKRLLGFVGSDARGATEVWKNQLGSLGFVYLSSKPPRLEDSARVFAFGASRFPREELFQRGLGRVAQEQGRYAEAMTHFEQALAIRSRPGAHYRLAQVAEKLGDTAKAMLHYEKVLRIGRGVPRSALSEANERLKALQAAAR